MKIIPIVLIVFIVPAVLNLISTSAAKHSSGTIDNFVMRPAGMIAGLGWLCAIFFLVCIIGSSVAGQFKGALAAIFTVLFLLGVLLILAPVKGFWDVTVEGSRMTSSRVWVIRKTIDIDDIDHLEFVRGGINIYTHDGRKAMSVDGMSTNLDKFETIVEEKGITIK